jgi:D-3-phosphoglycerate dehydrogenase / 2-oxoglutarate reductase
MPKLAIAVDGAESKPAIQHTETLDQQEFGRSADFCSRADVEFLLLEAVNDSAVHLLDAAGYKRVRRLSQALDRSALRDALRPVHVIGIRSRSELDKQILREAPKLMAIGCFSVGVNQVDLDAARWRGIPVFNAPFSNTRSVAELVIGEIIMLMRRTFPRSLGAHQGEWDKSSRHCHEVRGKTLGIVGYGNVGTQLSTLAEALGMRVIFHDVVDKLRHGNAEVAGDLQSVLAHSDVVSLHVPETRSTHGMIGAAELRTMKPGAFLINNSRGNVVDVEALADAIRSGHLAGAAVDVFPSEPKAKGEMFESPLQGLENVILTPHIGGSTEEAQERIGAEVVQKLKHYIETGATVGAVNFPQVQLPPPQTGVRYIHMHQNVPGSLGLINDVFSRHGINITAQVLETDGDIGYVVIDADECRRGSQAVVLHELGKLQGTIRARLLQKRGRAVARRVSQKAA